MEELNYSLKLAQRKEKAEAQAKKYFYEAKQGLLLGRGCLI